MYIFKELVIYGDEAALEEFASSVESYFPADWVNPQNDRLKGYIVADYVGSNVTHAEVRILFDDEKMREGHINVVNIVPLDKKQLTVDEYTTMLDLFYADIVRPYADCHSAVRAEESDLSYIDSEAFGKLKAFCINANKTTGSSYPRDEKRWFDFVCQTVDDGRTFDYDTLRRLLSDEGYWGEFCDDGKWYAWGEEKAAELALEYDNYVRLLKHYKTKHDICD